MELDLSTLVLRLVVAALLGGVVGLEREMQQKAVGLRTNMMVALGAAAFTLATIGLLNESPVADVARIIQGVAAGIGDFTVAAVTAGISVFVLFVIGWLEVKISGKESSN